MAMVVIFIASIFLCMSFHATSTKKHKKLCFRRLRDICFSFSSWHASMYSHERKFECVFMQIKKSHDQNKLKLAEI